MTMYSTVFLLFASSFHLVMGAPTAKPEIIQPGESSYYSDYRGVAEPIPAKFTKAGIPATKHGEPGKDDLLFQNLLSAEWAIYSFYQQGVERFNASAFVEAGFPNTTYDRISEIRDNEAGHLAIFQDQISSTSVKPGACGYIFPSNDAKTYLELVTVLEVSSMAFLTGLVLHAELDASKSALVAIAETESRHNTWSLIDLFNANPFAGPSDTIFPYANEILDVTNAFIKPGSCPSINPPYPSPSQHLPTLSYAANQTGEPGSDITLRFPDEKHQPKFDKDKEYFLVAFHGPTNQSATYHVDNSSAVVPHNIEPHKGIIVFVLADQKGAPTLDSVVAGPLIMPQF